MEYSWNILRIISYLYFFLFVSLFNICLRKEITLPFLVISRYDVMNFQRLQTSNGTYFYDYVQIGAWDSGNLTMNSSAIMFPNQKNTESELIESVCSKPCSVGEIKVGRDSANCCISIVR